MDKAIDYIQGKIDSISQDIACKFHEMKDMPENEKSYNMALLQPFIDLHAELEALIKFCALAKLSDENGALPIPDVRLSLPSEEDIREPIQSALYATRRFLTDECTELADGILTYLNDYGFKIVRQ